MTWATVAMAVAAWFALLPLAGRAVRDRRKRRQERAAQQRVRIIASARMNRFPVVSPRQDGQRGELLEEDCYRGEDDVNLPKDGEDLGWLLDGDSGAGSG